MRPGQQPCHRLLLPELIVPGAPLAVLTDNTTAFDIPIAPTLGPSNNIVAADLFNNRIVVRAALNSTSPPADTELHSFNNSGQLGHPWGVAVDFQYNIYATDNTCQLGGACRVLVLAGIRSTSPGTETHSCVIPSSVCPLAGITLDKAGYIYVGDAGLGVGIILAGLHGSGLMTLAP